jgi:cytochrome oxidase Cu insertion factor (SCO1/SenC/PrrC family)
LPVLGSVPAFSLTERSEETVARSDLEGQVWVADFIFTQCAGPCPLLSSRMSDLQDALRDRPDVRLVSFSVDPENDTPEVLSQYAKRFRADPDRWLFLTGDKTEIYQLVKNGFKLAVADSSTPESPSPGIITHSTRIVLVDRKGRIRGYYHGTESDLEEKILPAIEELVKEPA